MKKTPFGAVEMGIFAMVSMVFLNSVYHLLTDRMTVPTVPHASPLSQNTIGRYISAEATAEKEIPYETKCMASGEVYETRSKKLRIVGPFCGSKPTIVRKTASEPVLVKSSLTESKIENRTTRYAATIFNDFESNRFSTDFIPLEYGINKIHMEFHYKSGKVFPIDVNVTRN